MSIGRIDLAGLSESPASEFSRLQDLLQEMIAISARCCICHSVATDARITRSEHLVCSVWSVERTAFLVETKLKS